MWELNCIQMRRQVGNSLRSGLFEGCYHYSWIAWRYSIMYSPEFLQKVSSLQNQHSVCSESRSEALTWRPILQFYFNWQCLTLLEHPWDRWELPAGDVRGRDLRGGVLQAPECQEQLCRYKLIILLSATCQTDTGGALLCLCLLQGQPCLNNLWHWKTSEKY